MKSILKKSLGILEYIVLAVIVIAMVFVFISNSKGKPFFVFGKSIVWVMTESMEPEIPRQSYILIEKTDPGKIAVGDVILFYSDDPALAGQKNTHRVVEVIDNGKEFVTKGDNNLKNDDYTAKAQKTIGVYKDNLPFLTVIGRFIASPLGLIIANFFIFVIIVLLYFPEMKKAKKAWDEKLKAEKQKEFDLKVSAEVEKLKAQNQQQPPKDKDDSQDSK